MGSSWDIVKISRRFIDNSSVRYNPLPPQRTSAPERADGCPRRDLAALLGPGDEPELYCTVLHCAVLYCTVLYSVQVMSQTELDSMAAVSQYHRQQEAGMCQVRSNTVHLQAYSSSGMCPIL